jgi:hypothetical protein
LESGDLAGKVTIFSLLMSVLRRSGRIHGAGEERLRWRILRRCVVLGVDHVYRRRRKVLRPR